MPFSRITYTYSGQSTFAINFTLGYLSEDDVTCRVNDEVDGSDDPVYRTITFVTEGTVSISGSLTTGDTIVFERTVSKDALQNDYQDGAIIIEENLDDSFKQAVMLAHEVLDGRFGVLAENLDLGNNRLTNVANPVNAQDAATKDYIDTFGAINTTTILAAVDLAEQWATEDEDVVVEGGMYSAKHWAIKSQAASGGGASNKFDATSTPTADWDSSDTAATGTTFAVGSKVVNVSTDKEYSCMDATPTSAVWKETTLSTSDLGTLAVLDEVSVNELRVNAVQTSKILNGAVTFVKLGSSAIASASDLASKTTEKLVTADLIGQQVIGRSFTILNGVDSSTTEIPDDNTVPQITEGEEIASVIYNKQSSTSKLYVEVNLLVGGSESLNAAGVALFKNGGSDAIRSVPQRIAGSGSFDLVTFKEEVTGDPTGNVTFTIRMGPDNPGTMYLNRSGTVSDIHGAASKSTIEITEVET